MTFSKGFIIAPSQAVLENEGFQIKLRDAINRIYAEVTRTYNQKCGLNYSSRKYQDHICARLYDYKGDIYICDDDGRFHKHKLPDVSQVLGYDARFLRDFMRQHRTRRDFYKLFILAVFVGILEPWSYEGLISVY